MVERETTPVGTRHSVSDLSDATGSAGVAAPAGLKFPKVVKAAPSKSRIPSKGLPSPLPSMPRFGGEALAAPPLGVAPRRGCPR